MNEKLKGLYARLLDMKPVLPGSLSEQYNVCGKANCRCKDRENPRRHGPQLKLGYSLDGRKSTLVVKKADRNVAGRMNANFCDWRRLQIEINEEILRLYKEAGANETHALVGEAWECAKERALGARKPHPSLKRLQSSCDSWKEKAKSRALELRKDSVKIRDLAVSRDRWKEKYTSLKRDDEERITELARLKREKAERDGLISTLEAQAKKGRPTTS